ncbi:MAG: isoprenylcysteine carboxylmethyltransferase family protein [Acidobacteria bacterium]|nr:MAG: isoprenylcysteine carboxylmethyltransferase family protein [Acidobacteriota bacterium]
MADAVTTWLARKRVAIGLALAVITLFLARPTWTTWQLGLLVAAVGQAVRVWAAGHLEKSREVTRSGPYRWSRHPLYVGSTIMAAGIIIASRSAMVAVLATIYMVTTLTAAIRSEEAFLTRAFGETYDRYRESRAEPMERRFSLARAMRNREYRAAAGLAAGFALLALKVSGYL